MEWCISIVRDGTGFQLVEGMAPVALGFVAWDGQHLHTRLSEPLSHSDAAFLGQAITKWVTAQQSRVAHIMGRMFQQIDRIGREEI
jgi:hypothetical protein